MRMNYIFSKKLVQIESTKDHPEKKLEILDLIERKFSSKLFIMKFNYENRPSIVLSNTKSKKLDLIICIHADVVSADKKLFKIKNDKERIYSRGTYDMKSTLLASLIALSESGTQIKIAVFTTTDEEIDDLPTKLLLEKGGYYADLAIIPDGGSLNSLVNSQKGFLQLKLSFKGKSAHASEPWNDCNPAEIAIKSFETIKSDFQNPKNSSDWKTSLCLTKMSSGESLNQIPDATTLFLDIRLIPSDSIDKILKRIKRNCPRGTGIEIVASNNAFHVDHNNNLIEQLSKIISSITNKQISFVREASTSDAVYFSASNIPAILFRPDGANIHQDNEYICQKSLGMFYEIIYKFINNNED